MTGEPWMALPAGLVISALVSAIGISGGILWMPFLLIVLKLPPERAVLSSLLIQTAGMGSSAGAFLVRKQVDVKLGLALMLMALPGIGVGAYIAARLRPGHPEVLLGLIAMVTAFLFVSSQHRYDDLGVETVHPASALKYSWAISALSVMSGMISVSIGEWLVPILRAKLSMRMSRSIATSIFTIFGTCVLAVSSHLLLGGKAHGPTVLWGAAGVLAGGQIGPRLALRINERILKELFIFVLTLLGIHLLYHSF